MVQVMGVESVLTTRHQFYHKGHQTGKASLGTPSRLPHKCAESIFSGLLFWLFICPAYWSLQFFYPCLIYHSPFLLPGWETLWFV